MRLISCYIANFGLHSNKKIDFSRGMNSFYWKNGEGKTTLTVFIKAMLYGLGDNRGKDNERKKYEPWQGGRYGGSLTFEVGGKVYVAERTFGKKVAEDSFTLYDEKTGGVSNSYSENLGIELFGIDQEGFMRTAFWSEKTMLPSERINASVASRLSDIMGSDGDVGNYEAAQEKLDKKRKIYMLKKGKGGEIYDLSCEIESLKSRLDMLELIARDCEKYEADLSAVRERISILNKEASALSDRKTEIEKLKNKRKYRETYEGYLNDLNNVEEKIAELERFFGERIPTEDEILAIKNAKAEADRLRLSFSEGNANDELDRLSLTFSTITSYDINEVDGEIRNLDTNTKRLSQIESGMDERSREMRLLFPARVPTASEIEENIAKASEKESRLPKALIFIGITLLFAGIGCGFINPLLFSICALGVTLSIVGAVLGKRRSGGGVGEACAFLGEIAPSFTGDILGKLYEKKNDLERYERLKAAREEELANLNEKIDTGRHKIDNFYARLGMTPSYTGDGISRVRDEYSRYQALLKIDEETAGGRAEAIRKESVLRSSVAEFTGRYPTVTNNPLAEIEEKLGQLKYHKRLASDHRERCKKFATDYGITEEKEDFDDGEELRINTRLCELEEELNECRTRENELMRLHSNAAAELEAEDDIRAELAAKEERLDACKRSCRIIDRTKELLKLAHENMTEKYTGKTHERFTHYMRIITGDDADYKLDTAFAITRLDGGSMHSEDQYSRGTKDLYAMAMRLALTDSLYDGELPFLVLDDPFISYDDERGARARGLLSQIAKERQILYFTCSDSRDI